MVKSMTGYGRASGYINGKTITCELRSVNQRYFDATVKLPRVYGFLEEPIKKQVQNEISRGKIDVYISIDLAESDSMEVLCNKPVLKAYLEAFKGLHDEYAIENNIKMSDVIKLPELFTVQKKEEDMDALKGEVFPILEEAIKSYAAFRTFEGQKMYDDILSRIQIIRDYKNLVEKKNPSLVDVYRSKLEERIRELLGSTVIDENRILTEVAIYADKTAVDEETVRLESHLQQLADLISAEVPVGRKLDFLLQEMNRETNTIGSKVNDTELTECVVNIKCELEKIREQIQNIE